MSLPKIKLPLFELVQPSTGKKLKFRPFTVKEEKILLIAQQSKEFDQVILATKQIINNCFEKIDVDSLPMFDIEYMLIHLRAKSVSNELKFTFKDQETDEIIEGELDLNDITLHKDPKHNRIIQINDDTVISLKYPTMDELVLAKDVKDDDAEGQFKLLMACLDTVSVDDQVTKFADASEEEVVEFVDSLQSSVINDIKNFFETMPVLRYEYKYTNNKGKEKTLVLEGQETFFI